MTCAQAIENVCSARTITSTRENGHFIHFNTNHHFILINKTKCEQHIKWAVGGHMRTFGHGNLSVESANACVLKVEWVQNNLKRQSSTIAVKVKASYSRTIEWCRICSTLAYDSQLHRRLSLTNFCRFFLTREFRSLQSRGQNPIESATRSSSTRHTVKRSGCPFRSIIIAHRRCRSPMKVFWGRSAFCSKVPITIASKIPPLLLAVLRCPFWSPSSIHNKTITMKLTHPHWLQDMPFLKKKKITMP